MYRARHINTPRLQWDEELARTAQAYARFMAKNNFFEHSERYRHLGENLYFSSNTGGISEKGMCNEAAKAWYVLIDLNIVYQYKFRALAEGLNSLGSRCSLASITHSVEANERQKPGLRG